MPQRVFEEKLRLGVTAPPFLRLMRASLEQKVGLLLKGIFDLGVHTPQCI
jgi:hypothetical protein